MRGDIPSQYFVGVQDARMQQRLLPYLGLLSRSPRRGAKARKQYSCINVAVARREFEHHVHVSLERHISYATYALLPSEVSYAAKNKTKTAYVGVISRVSKLSEIA